MKLLKSICLLCFAFIHTNAFSYGVEELDQKLFTAISKEANVELNYAMPSQENPWGVLMNKIKAGTVQTTGNATVTEERKKWAKYTIPYRYEEEVAYLAANNSHVINSDADFIKLAIANKMKIGILKGGVHATAKLNAFANDPQYADMFVQMPTDHDSANALINGKVDAILGDRLSLHNTKVATNNNVTEFRMNAKDPVAFILTKYGKNAVTDDQIQKLNAAIETLTKNGFIQKEFDKLLAAL